MTNGIGDNNVEADYEVKEKKTLTVKDFNPDERPRERALKYGCKNVSTVDLWAIILRTGLVGYPITKICSDLMSLSGGKILNLERKSPDQLMEVRGIGQLKMLQIQAVMELAKRYYNEALLGNNNSYKITGADSIHRYMVSKGCNFDDERIWIIFLNRGLRVIGDNCVSEGGTTSAVFDLKKILRLVLTNKADAVVMCHNHPSGNLIPSAQDDQITRKLKDALALLDVRMLDHVIVSQEGYYSYHDHGRVL